MDLLNVVSLGVQGRLSEMGWGLSLSRQHKPRRLCAFFREFANRLKLRDKQWFQVSLSIMNTFTTFVVGLDECFRGPSINMNS